MKRGASRIAALLSGILFTTVCCAAVVKPTTEMVWNDDFAEDSKKGNLTLASLNGNEVTEEGFLKIESGNRYGVQFTGKSNLLNKSTIIIQGEMLYLQNSHPQVLLTLQENTINSFSEANYIGAALCANNTGCQAIFNASLVKDSIGTTSITKRGATLVFQYDQKNIKLSEVITDSATGTLSLIPLFSHSQSISFGLSGLTIGGICPYSTSAISNAEEAAAWTIQKLAVFTKVLSEEEILAYLKPRWKGFLLIIR